nr:MAG TPA: hypothetical protein [Caudoviricetes sp.]
MKAILFLVIIPWLIYVNETTIRDIIRKNFIKFRSFNNVSIRRIVFFGDYSIIFF